MNSGNYNKYHTNNPFKRKLIDRFIVKISSLLDQAAPLNWLDAGCGEGLVIKALSNKVQKLKPSEIWGIDISSQALKIAKEKNPEVNFKQSDIIAIPFLDNSFDLVTCLEVLEHLNTPKKALKEILRVCKRQAIISVPNEPLFSHLRLLTLNDVKKLGRHKEHINTWNKKTFLQFIQAINPNLSVEIFTSTPWLIARITKSADVVS